VGAAAGTPLLTARGRSSPCARRAEGRGRRREELPDRLLLLLLLLFVLRCVIDLLLLFSYSVALQAGKVVIRSQTKSRRAS